MMLKNFFLLLKSPQVLTALLLLAIGLGVIMLSVKEYKSHSQQDIEVSSDAAQAQSIVTVQELQAMFSGSSASEDYEVIASKNLFSSNREAWTPPETKEDNDPEPDQNRRKSGIDQKAVKLYGTTLNQEQRLALIYYQGWPENERHRLLREGETAYQEAKGEELFLVTQVDKDSVTLEDNTGETFTVSLFGHERQQAKSKPSQEASIIVGGKEVKTASVQEDAQGSKQEQAREGATDDAQPETESGEGSEVTEEEEQLEAEQEASGDGQAPRSLQDVLERLRGGSGGQAAPGPDSEPAGQPDGEDKRRIETPFGPVYRPAD